MPSKSPLATYLKIKSMSAPLAVDNSNAMIKEASPVPRKLTYQDKTLSCADCGLEFIFGAAEQEFYAQKSLTNLPKRCENCRIKRRLLKDGKDPNTFNEVSCANCGAKARVPFKPSGHKPVYCTSCFKKQKDDQKDGQ